VGQTIGAVVAESRNVAEQAAAAVIVTYDELPAIITIEVFYIAYSLSLIAFSALTLLVGRLSGGMLAWLCVWVKMQIAYRPADATATHYLLLQ